MPSGTCAMLILDRKSSVSPEAREVSKVLPRTSLSQDAGCVESAHMNTLC